MRRWWDRLFVVLIFAIAAGSIYAIWPDEPDRYFPDWMNLPSGKGVPSTVLGVDLPCKSDDADETKRVEREPLTRQTSHGLFGLLVVSRYVLIGPDGTVLDVDRMHWEDDGRFVIDLPQELSPGAYTVALAIFLDGNSLLPSARLLRLRIGERRPAG